MYHLCTLIIERFFDDDDFLLDGDGRILMNFKSFF